MNSKGKHFLLSFLLGTACIVGLIGLLATGLSQVAHAAGPWYVNAATGNDSNDCLSAGAACKTVGAAVSKASPGDTINIAGGTYAENLSLSKSLTLTGAGAGSTFLDGGGSDRVVLVSGITVTLSSLTVQNGATTGNGGGIYNGGALTLTQVVVANNTAGFGGGLFNEGKLSISDSALRDNQTTSSNGGGLVNNNDTDSVTLTNVTLSGNTAANVGGGFHNQGAAPTTLTNVTISDNTSAWGGGLYNTGGGNLTIVNATIADNHIFSGSGPGGIQNYSSITFTNSIVANNDNSNCANAATWTSSGYNLDSGNTCSFGQGTDLTNADPKLTALEDHGGDTETHALAIGSPAIDAGTNTGCPATDQRGQARPVNGTCDIGAFEFTSTPLSTVAISGDTAGFTNSAYAFQATAAPITATHPVTYTWQATDQSPVTRTGASITDTVTFNWASAGTKTITVTADNSVNQQVDTHQIVISVGTQAITSVAISGPTAGSSNQSYTFNADVSPSSATLPITYTWQADGGAAVIHTGKGVTDTMSFSWSSEGPHVITVTAANVAGSQSDTHTITLSDWYVDGSSGDDGNSCQSAGNACKTIAGAMGKAADGDTIRIAAGTYSENLSVNKSLTFAGAGADQTFIDGGGSDRVLWIDNSSGATASVAFSGVTVQNGSGNPGGIYNKEALTIVDSVIKDNANPTELGGAIFNDGTLSITNSALSGNSAYRGGSGIFNNGGQVSLEKVTLSGNSGGAGGDAVIHNQSGGTADLTNVTISGNTGTGLSNGATVTMLNSAIANNSNVGVFNSGVFSIKNSILTNNNGGGDNCDDTSGGALPLTSQGYNLDSGNSCGLNGSGDLTDTDPKLRPLADYGGDTQTHALFPISPAIDAGTNTGCPATDQRGTARPIDGDGDSTATCDMGALEYNFEKFLVFLPVVIRNN